MRVLCVIMAMVVLLSCRVQKNVQKMSTSVDSSFSVVKESESTKEIKETFESMFLFDGDSLEGVATPEPGQEVSFESGSQVITIGKDSTGSKIKFKAIAKPRETSIKGSKVSNEKTDIKEQMEGKKSEEIKTFKKDKEVISYPWIGFAISAAVVAFLLFILYRKSRSIVLK